MSWCAEFESRVGADGNGIDALMHVEPDTTKCKERAMLVVFNQQPNVAVNTTLRIPLYYSGLDRTAAVSREDRPPTTLMVQRDWSVELLITMAPNSVAWYVFT